MKILLIMDPGITIPVKGYGGIERIVDMLAQEYACEGHDVHLLVTDGSKVEGCTVHGYGKEGFPPNKWDARAAVLAAWTFLKKHGPSFDLIHNFGRLIYLLPVLNHPVKKIMSYQREISRRNIRIVQSLPGKNLFFTGCSQSLINRAHVRGNWEAIHNSCDFTKYGLQKEVDEDAPLVFLGRLERVKGCHTAIHVARATGNRLVIAGNISNLPEEKTYYEKEIAPFVDGQQIRYVGTVDDAAKNKLLGQAKAILFPIEWEEPFGIVLVEAMACGTPVIAFDRGSVGEVVENGVTGFKVHTKEEMIDALNNISQISRGYCRMHAMSRFHSKVVAMRYLHMVNPSRKRVVILSTHQPAANPRAMKEYEALKAHGYAVHYFYAYNYNWSHEVDEKKFRTGGLAREHFLEVAGNPRQAPFRYLLSRIGYHVFRKLADMHPFCRRMAMARPAFALWQAAAKIPADLYIAHYLGAMPGACRAARRHKAKIIFDAEDFHRGEKAYYPRQKKDVAIVEQSLLPLVDAVTAASPLIAKEYRHLFPQKPVVTVSNAFSVKNLQPLYVSESGTLRLFWFSQNIGKNRGLEVFVKALNDLPSADITLTIMGNRRSQAYERSLLALADEPHRIRFIDTVAPEETFAVAAQHHIGLAGEVPDCWNKQVCLSNKIFAYLLAGNCILASDMEGQKKFFAENPGVGFVYRHDDPKDLADKIRTLYNDRQLLNECRNMARAVSSHDLNREAEDAIWLGMIERLTGKMLVESKVIHQAKGDSTSTSACTRCKQTK